jgi:hypothetical protein
MEKVNTRGTVIEIPSAIEELTPQQYEYYCFLAFALAAGTIDIQQFRLRWFSYLIGYRRANYTILKPEYVSELDKQMATIDGFFVDDKGKLHVQLDTTVNLLPTYKGYTGPGDWLEGVTFGQFVDCYTILETISDAADEEAVKGYEQIARRLYNIPEADMIPNLLTFHAPRLFANVWRAIQTAPIEINGKKIDFRIIFKSNGKSRPDDKTGWTGIIFEIAGAGVFGSVKEVEQTEFWTILLYLYKCKFEYNNENKSK